MKWKQRFLMKKCSGACTSIASYENAYETTKTRKLSVLETSSSKFEMLYPIYKFPHPVCAWIYNITVNFWRNTYTVLRMVSSSKMHHNTVNSFVCTWELGLSYMFMPRSRALWTTHIVLMLFWMVYSNPVFQAMITPDWLSIL